MKYRKELLKLAFSSACITIYAQSILNPHGFKLFWTSLLPIFFLTTFCSLIFFWRACSMVLSRFTGSSFSKSAAKDANTYLFSALFLETLLFQKDNSVLFIFNRMLEPKYVLLALGVFLIGLTKVIYGVRLRRANRLDNSLAEKDLGQIRWRYVGLSLLLVLLTISLGAAASLASVKRKRGEMNVLLIIIDTVRADHTTFLGSKNDTTPFLNRLARHSIVFEHAISNASFTPSSISAVMTSIYPSSLGMFTFNNILSDSVTTMAERLNRHGYLTGAITSNFFVSGNSGLDQGFMSFSMTNQQRGEEVTAAAMQWLRRNWYRKFFLFLHYNDPHSEYLPPAAYARKFQGDYTGHITGSLDDILKFYTPQKYGLTQRDLKHVMDLYDGEIAYADDCIKGLFDELEKLHLADNTVIIILADHGEEFLAHSTMGHFTSAYEEVIHVPLIMRIPSYPQPRKVEQQVQLVDVLPTVLDILGIDIPRALNGHSLLSLIRNGNDPANGSRYAFTVSGYDADGKGAISVRNEHYKLIRHMSRKEEFYDLKADPQERNNLIDSRIPEIDIFRRMLNTHIRAAEENQTKYRGRVVEYTNSDLQKIKALGYLK